MLTLSGVSKSYGDRVLFADAALQVNRGDRIGLVGPNGAGKSTLFNLVLGEESADEGNITFQRGTSVGSFRVIPQRDLEAAGLERGRTTKDVEHLRYQGLLTSRPYLVGRDRSSSRLPNRRMPSSRHHAAQRSAARSRSRRGRSWW